MAWSGAAIAGEPSLPASAELSAPVTPVAQLADVSPEDWAFQALRSLVEQHGCSAELPEPDSETRVLTRFEFAAVLQTCLAALDRLDAADWDADTRAAVQRLQAFAAERAALAAQIDGLEQETDRLAAQQFSATAELEGEVIVALSGAFGEERADGGGAVDDGVVLSDRLELTLEASFTGEDELQVKLEAGNTPEFEDATGTQMANLGFDGGEDNQLELDELSYQFRLSDATAISLSAVGGGIGDFVPTVNPLLSGSGSGAISTFGRENPIRRQGSGTGIGISHDFSDTVNLAIGAVAAQAEDAAAGIFGGRYGAIAQLTLRPSDVAALSFTYVHSYNSSDTGTGSRRAGDLFDGSAEQIAADSWGAEMAWQLSPTLTLGGRVGLLQASAEDLPDEPIASVLTWAVLLAATDVGQEGSVLGVVVGQPPRAIANEWDEEREDPDVSLHLEAFYRLQLSDNLAITPGVFVVTAPEHDSHNRPIYIGTLRTTFTF